GRRVDAVITAVRRASEAAAWIAEERPRNHPADARLVEQCACDFAYAIEPLQTESFFVSGDLKDAVRRGVADRLAAAYVRFAQLLDDLRARSVSLAEHAMQTRRGAQRIDQLGCEARLFLREIAPFESHGGARDLPMAGLRVLARGYFGGGARATMRPRIRAQADGRVAGCDATALCDAERRQVGDAQGAASQARSIAPAGGAALRDVSQRGRALVAERCCVGRSAHAEGIEHKQERPAHAACSARSKREPPLCAGA